MKNLAIKVNGRPEIKEVLKALDRYGLKWNDGTSATEFNPPSNTVVICVGYRTENRITYGDDMDFRPSWQHETITAGEFLKGSFDKITIERNGRKITAKDECGNHASARCCPDDDFDFYTGAKLALERLEKQTKGFKPGDLVEVINDSKSFITLPEEYFQDYDELRRYAFGCTLENGRLGKVKRIRYDDKVYVEHGRQIFVIGASGLKKA